MPLLMCPNCNAGMQEISRNDVQIDVCPACRGVWLDRGELEKLLSAVNAVRREYADEAPPARQAAHGGENRHYKSDDRGHYKKKKKMDFLDVFDIF